MVQYSNIDRVMEAENHVKHGASSKSQMSRGNFLRTLIIVFVMPIILAPSVSVFAQENVATADTVTKVSKTDSKDINIYCHCPSSPLYRTSPLVLIDGLEVSIDVLTRLTSNDVKNYVVISDAKEAFELYGARGVNGVIVISSNLKKKDLKKMIKIANNNKN